MEFGKYPHSMQPLSFRKMISEKDYNIFLAEKAVTAHCFHENFGKEKIYWESCSLHTWLQHDFLVDYFSETQRERIIEINIPTISQLLTWFPVQADRKCFASEQAVEDGIVLFAESGNSCTYWLQDTGRIDGMSATVVLPNGGIYQSAYMMADNVGVRPYVIISK